MSMGPVQLQSVVQMRDSDEASTIEDIKTKDRVPLERPSSPSDQIEMREEEGGTKESSNCLMLCFTWIYELFASLFRCLCCKTQHKGEEASSSTEEESSKVEDLPTKTPTEAQPVVPQPSLEELTQSNSALPNSERAPPTEKLPPPLSPPSLSKPISPERDVQDMLPAQRASAFCKASDENSLRAFLAFGLTGESGKRIQLWILHKLASDTTQPSNAKLFQHCLACSDGLTEKVDRQFIGGATPHAALIRFFKEELGIEQLKPYTDEVYVRRPRDEKPIENAKGFIGTYLALPFHETLYAQFQSYRPMTQLCILYPLMSKPKHACLFFAYLSKDLAEFVNKEGRIDSDQEGQQLRETFKEIIAIYLPTAIPELDSLIKQLDSLIE